MGVLTLIKLSIILLAFIILILIAMLLLTGKKKEVKVEEKSEDK